MLVNHLAKRHPDISPDSVAELNLPILKTTRDYYCQYCEKIYRSSSKRKAHILKNHPGAELRMSNRRKGGIPEIPGIPNPTFSQTVGSVTTHPHGCPWWHKQYASKAKLLQHQRKKHIDLLPQNQQLCLYRDDASVVLLWRLKPGNTCRWENEDFFV
ncbi:PR domain zinc finger protein 10 [Zootermopsis nevadensis]|uniref:PR domain zinc finger protein 10 n=1 Tax=Zootermopsis nevadensis TaxID=136037 RepID=A0A067QV81_ZOONE|nr:PR domain zinc finger protein 10 [Zootermopsis nevadensis]